MSGFDLLIIALIALIAIGFTTVVAGVAYLVADDRRRARADRLLVALQALEQMGAADTPEYDALNARYAELTRPTQGYPVPFAD